MPWQHNYSLREKNTFGIEAQALRFQSIKTLTELQSAVEECLTSGEKPLILGGGSNILFTQDVRGPVLEIELRGIEVLQEDDEHVLLRVAAGENWHELVMHCVNRGWGGIENLSLIPGRCGAAPMQNIGAYGIEIKEVLQSVELLHLESAEAMTLSNSDCHFGYRDSIFKNELKGKVIITSILVRLNKNHSLHIEYGAIRDTLNEMGIEEPGIADVSRAVIHIRRSKLPDPAVTGNAGSFFKNPEVDARLAQALKVKNPQMPAYDLPDGRVKIPAAWLIEQCGWKGKSLGNAGCHSRQPLVLINLGGATGSEILQLAQTIQRDVKERFGIELHTEVNII